jgi:hypothetical protein
MAFTLDQVANECRRILTADPGPEGRGRVRQLVEEVLKDDAFLRTYLNENTPDRQVIYEDPELGFCICAHMNRDAKEANPHDHGSSWAIYGQAIGETEMSDWEVIESPADGKPGKVRRARVYTLRPGMAHLYNEGDVHSPKRATTTGLIRIEGKNTQKMKRLAYQNTEA